VSEFTDARQKQVFQVQANNETRF